MLDITKAFVAYVADTMLSTELFLCRSTFLHD